MKENKLNKILRSNESETLEFNSSFDKETVETIVAFSNCVGGTILIGVENRGNVVGVGIGKETCQNIVNQIKQATIPQIFPDVEVVKY